MEEKEEEEEEEDMDSKIDNPTIPTTVNSINTELLLE